MRMRIISARWSIFGRALRLPVYATPFTAGCSKPKLAEPGCVDGFPLHDRAAGGRRKLGPFDIELIAMSPFDPGTEGAW